MSDHQRDRLPVCSKGTFMIDQKSLLLQTLAAHEHTYESIVVRAAAVRLEDKVAPLAAVFTASHKGERASAPQCIDYEEFAFVEGTITIGQLRAFVENLCAGETVLRVAGLEVEFPSGLFRKIREDQADHDEQMTVLKHSGPLGNDLIGLLQETRSHTESWFRQWPTRTYAFEYLHRMTYDLDDRMRAALRRAPKLPLMPSVRDALGWWFGGYPAYSEGYILFHLADFTGRIAKVNRTRGTFQATLESRTHKPGELLVKYHVRQADGSVTADDVKIGDDWKCLVPFPRDAQRAFIALTDASGRAGIIDHRDYSFDAWSKSVLDYVADPEELEFRVSGGEDETTEFKFDIEVGKEKEFLESVTSFSNTLGGWILVGVNDNGNVAGLASDKAQKLEDRIHELIRLWVEPKPTFAPKRLRTRDKLVLAVIVVKGQNAPYNYRDHGVYVRAGSTDRKATRDELLTMTVPLGMPDMR
jgi:hypothetical protein